MHIENVLYQLTPTEQFGFTPPFIQTMCEWNHASQNPILWAVASRIVGFVIIPFSEIFDTFLHLGIAALKGCIGVLVFPYNSLALVFFPESIVRPDFELSSSLIHLWQVVECLFGAAILPFICLLNPDAAFRCMGYRLDLHAEERAALNREIGDLRARSERLRLELAQANHALERTQNNGRELPTADSETARLLNESCSQNESLQIRLNHVNNELVLKEERIVLLQQELERAKANSSEMDQLQLRKDEEDKQRLNAANESLREQMTKNNSENEKKLLQLNQQISQNTAQIEEKTKSIQANEFRLVELTQERTQMEETLKNLQEKSKQHDLLKVEFEAKNNQICQLEALKKKDEEEKQSLNAAIESLKDQMTKNASENESAVLTLENKIAELKNDIQRHIKIELKIKKLKEKAVQVEPLIIQNKILQTYCNSHEEELTRLRIENNKLRDGQSLDGNEEGKLIKSPSQHGF